MTLLRAIVHLCWALTLSWCVYCLAPPLAGLVVEMGKDCVVGIPERPEGKGWHLTWTQQKRNK